MTARDGPRRSLYPRAGLLVIRAWIDDDDGRLVARVAATADIARDHPRTRTTSDPQTVLDWVQGWFEAIQAPRPGDPPASEG